MTTFDQDEKSVAASRPVHLYTFTTPTNVYRYTSYIVDVVRGGFTWTAIPTAWADLQVSMVDDAADWWVVLPYDTQFVLDEVLLKSPERSITFQLDRLQQVSGILTTWHIGVVTEFNIDDIWCKVRVPGLMDDLLGTQLPSVRYQKQCNHDFGDDMCTIDTTDSSIRHTTTVTAIDGAAITIASRNGHAPLDYFDNGKMIRVLDGEEREITTHGPGPSPLVMYIIEPFRTLNVGEQIIMVAGCRHDMRACSRFDNTDNYGGMPYIPSANIYVNGLDPRKWFY